MLHCSYACMYIHMYIHIINKYMYIHINTHIHYICSCCTAGPDLMDSILKLIRLSIRRDIVYDRIVVEMSGVSEPRNLRDDFQDSKDTHQVLV